MLLAVSLAARNPALQLWSLLPGNPAHQPNPCAPTDCPLPSLQLPLSDKGLKKLSESFRFYKHALHDEEVRVLPCCWAACCSLFGDAGRREHRMMPSGLLNMRCASHAGRCITVRWCSRLPSTAPVTAGGGGHHRHHPEGQEGQQQDGAQGAFRQPADTLLASIAGG